MRTPAPAPSLGALLLRRCCFRHHPDGFPLPVTQGSYVCMVLQRGGDVLHPGRVSCMSSRPATAATPGFLTRRMPSAPAGSIQQAGAAQARSRPSLTGACSRQCSMAARLHRCNLACVSQRVNTPPSTKTKSVSGMCGVQPGLQWVRFGEVSDRAGCI